MVHFPQLMLDFLLGKMTFDDALERSWKQMAAQGGRAVCGRSGLFWSINNRLNLKERMNWLDPKTKQLHPAYNQKTTCPHCIEVLKKHNL